MDLCWASSREEFSGGERCMSECNGGGGRDVVGLLSSMSLGDGKFLSEPPSRERVGESPKSLAAPGRHCKT